MIEKIKLIKNLIILTSKELKSLDNNSYILFKRLVHNNRGHRLISVFIRIYSTIKKL